MPDSFDASSEITPNVAVGGTSSAGHMDPLVLPTISNHSFSPNLVPCNQKYISNLASDGIDKRPVNLYVR
jgi:hypothetical protein